MYKLTHMYTALKTLKRAGLACLRDIEFKLTYTHTYTQRSRWA